MNVKRCDRCGRIYDTHDVDNFFNEMEKSNEKRRYYNILKITADEVYFPDTVDLCPVCMRLLINWIENISEGAIRE